MTIKIQIVITATLDTAAICLMVNERLTRNILLSNTDQPDLKPTYLNRQRRVTLSCRSIPDKRGLWSRPERFCLLKQHLYDRRFHSLLFLTLFIQIKIILLFAFRSEGSTSPLIVILILTTPKQ